jgi:hypothetical protein
MGGRLRFALSGTVVAVLVLPVGLLAQASPTSAASRTSGEARASGAPPASLCETHTFLCADTSRHKNYEGDYTGHDEPAISFHSNLPGSGNQAKYNLILPRDSAAAPTQNGKGGTWNFQLHPAFWLGMVMCDPQSSPEFTHAPCQPDSDKNVFDNPNPNAPDWIGHHPGSAFMEMQFYPPGWSSWPAGVSCTATKWCAALNIDSLNFSDPTGVDNNADCLAKVSDEPVNFAFITKSGHAHAPAGPLDNAVNKALVPNFATDMAMNSGDHVTLDMHDTPAGFQVTLHDATNGANGSMTASVANGFAQVQFAPKASRCTEKPYAFHPQFSTSRIQTRAEWTAHTLNVSYSDEIGHFEYCDKVLANGNCAGRSATDPTNDRDDNDCFAPGTSLLVKVGGCITDFDDDFDGPSYLKVWPGNGNAIKNTSEPIRFTSPTFDNGHRYSQVSFETDLLSLERAFGYCTSTTLKQCLIPPKGSAFYPMYTAGRSASGGCEWREGGPAIPNAINTFGGTPAKFWGKATSTFYPVGPHSTQTFFENFDNVLPNNPCQP